MVGIEAVDTVLIRERCALESGCRVGAGAVCSGNGSIELVTMVGRVRSLEGR